MTPEARSSKPGWKALVLASGMATEAVAKVKFYLRGRPFTTRGCDCWIAMARTPEV